MGTLTFTLVADGSSDAALMYLIEWAIRSHRPDVRVAGQFAREVGTVGLPLGNRLPVALRMFPCDILLIHRDAEGASLSERHEEIEIAVGGLHSHWVSIVPVRMTEAWLLSDESAIRAAAGNRSGQVDLKLPAKRQWESLPDPKRVLFDALSCATEKSGRALAKFSASQARPLVAPSTTDFSGLRGLRSFDCFEKQLVTILKDF